jgi:hypothetical protein
MLRSDEFDRVLAEVPEIARNQRFARIKALVCACNRPAPPMGLLFKKKLRSRNASQTHAFIGFCLHCRACYRWGGGCSHCNLCPEALASPGSLSPLSAGRFPHFPLWPRGIGLAVWEFV